jgi:hypothetical protein
VRLYILTVVMPLQYQRACEAGSRERAREGGRERKRGREQEKEREGGGSERKRGREGGRECVRERAGERETRTQQQQAHAKQKWRPRQRCGFFGGERGAYLVLVGGPTPSKPKARIEKDAYHLHVH